jgi:hypothetical protein
MLPLEIVMSADMGTLLQQFIDGVLYFLNCINIFFILQAQVKRPKCFFFVS